MKTSKNSKRIISLLLSALMLSSTFAFADDNEVITTELDSYEPIVAEPDAIIEDNINISISAVKDELVPEEECEIVSGSHSAETEAEYKQFNNNPSLGNNANTPSYVSEKNGQLSNSTIYIQSWEAEDMPTNSNYSYLTFTFSNSEDDTLYEAYISGIHFRVSSGQPYDVENVYALLADVADSFYAGKPFELSDSAAFADKYHLVVQPVDTEKIHSGTDGKVSSAGDTDRDLCWAASSSDMIQITGWNKGTNNTTISSGTEDNIFDYFEKYYTDDGGSQEYGIKWFFDGVNIMQNTDSNGDIIYYQNHIAGTTSQEKLADSTEGNVESRGLLADYAAEAVEKSYSVVESGYDALYDAALKLKEGFSTGLSVYFYTGDEKGGGHAITLIGYIRDTLKDGIDSLKSLFITDSDNNKFQTSTRENAVDSANMFLLESKDIPQSGQTVNALGLKDYDGDNFSAILFYDTLAPYSTYAQSAVDTSGTKDALGTIDYSIRSFGVRDNNDYPVKNANVGDTVYFWSTVKNESYKMLHTEDCDPYCLLSYTLSCDGEIIATVDTYTYLNKDSTISQRPNAANYLSSETGYQLTKAGTYTVSVELKGVYYEDAENQCYKFNEAYMLNNFSSINYVFNVDGSVDPSPSPAPVPVPSPNPKSDKTPPTYSAAVISSKRSVATVSITLENQMSDDLIIMRDGQLVPSTSYIISQTPNGEVKITFSRSYLSSLIPGIYLFHVLDSSANTVAYIELTVR